MVQVSPPQIPQEEFKPQKPIQLVVTVNRQYAQLNGLPDASILHYRGKKNPATADFHHVEHQSTCARGAWELKELPDGGGECEN